MAENNSITFSKTPYEIFGIECGDGWLTLVNPLINLCQQHGVKIAQIKSKFGTLRFYVDGEVPEIVRMAIEGAETISKMMCEQCGKPSSIKVVNNWLFNACEEHMPKGN
jgi:hypothetical protein